MGGSVGIGALIVGVGLIGVFVIANSAINAQMESSLEIIEVADDPLPSISFIDANLDEDAILSFTINVAGQGYIGNGVITCSANCAPGADFWATYDVNITGAVTDVTIESHGSGYSGASSPTLEISGDGGTITQTATFNPPTIGNALFANLTNDGSVTLDVDHMWISVDGDEPDALSPNHYNAFPSFFPGESISIVYLEGSASGTVDSLTVTALGAVESIRV